MAIIAFGMGGRECERSCKKTSRPDGLLRLSDRHSAKRPDRLRVSGAVSTTCASSVNKCALPHRKTMECERIQQHHIGAPKKSVFQRIKCMDSSDFISVSQWPSRCICVWIIIIVEHQYWVDVVDTDAHTHTRSRPNRGSFECSYK